MTKQSEIRSEVINIIREWDLQDDTVDKLSHRDLAIKIEGVYLLYAQQIAEDTRKRCAELGNINPEYYSEKLLMETIADEVLETEIILL